jgi:hypothetical protein
VDVDVALSKRVMMLFHHSEKRMINRNENDGSDVSKWPTVKEFRIFET